jgi:hypothetical protein
MSAIQKSRIRQRITVAAISIVLMLGIWNFGARPAPPSIEVLQSLIDGYAHAIETNNRELALWYIHPRSPRRPALDASLRDQLASHMERARTSNLERIERSDGTISAKLEQEIVRVFGMKLTHGSRRSIYHFRELAGSWRIWGIDEVADL